MINYIIFNMITNKIIDILTKIISFITLPIQLIIMLLLKIISVITFRLIFFPLNLIWLIFFYFPLIGLSYLYEKVYILRIPVSILGILFAVIGYEFNCFFAHYDGKRTERLLFCLIFPYSWHLKHYINCDFLIRYSNCYESFIKYINKIDPNRDVLTRDLIIQLKVKYNNRT